MPNRIIKESICSSDDLDQLTPFEETVFYRLIVRVDDYGRIDARPGFLKSMLFVTKQGITEKNIKEAVAKMASLGLVRLYEVGGKPFLMFPKWHLHQRIRNSKEKYPAPDGRKAENDGSPQVAASCGEVRPKSNPIQSESNLLSIDDLFLKTYQAYPRKDGKAEARNPYRKYLTDGKDIGRKKYRFNHQQIYFAVQQYAIECEGKEQQYIKLFSSFMNTAVPDYVDKTQPEYETFMQSQYGDSWQEVKFEYA